YRGRPRVRRRLCARGPLSRHLLRRRRERPGRRARRRRRSLQRRAARGVLVSAPDRFLRQRRTRRVDAAVAAPPSVWVRRVRRRPRGARRILRGRADRSAGAPGRPDLAHSVGSAFTDEPRGGGRREARGEAGMTSKQLRRWLVIAALALGAAAAVARTPKP